MSSRDKRLLVLVGLLAVVCLCLKLTSNDMADIAVKSSEKKIYLGDKVTLPAETYTCKPGETIYTYYAYGTDTKLKSLTSGNRFVAGISKVDIKDYKGAGLCLSCKPLKISCRLKGTTTVSVNTKNGQKATAKVIVTKNPSTIKFDKYDLKCNAGQTLALTITTDYNSRIKSYKVDNTSVATLKESTIQPYCPNCRRIDVVCKKQGSTTVRAYSTKGASTSTKLLVNPGSDSSNKVIFEKSSISCKKGEVVKTIIRSTDGKTRIKTFSSDDIAIAALSLSSAQPKTPGAIQVDVACRGNGSVTLRASNANGVVGTAKAKVGKAGTASVKFTKTSYTCKKGQTISIRANSYYATIKDITADKSGVVRVQNPKQQVNCSDCRVMDVVCLKTGTATLTVTARSMLTQSGTYCTAGTYCLALIQNTAKVIVK